MKHSFPSKKWHWLVPAVLLWPAGVAVAQVASSTHYTLQAWSADQGGGVQSSGAVTSVAIAPGGPAGAGVEGNKAALTGFIPQLAVPQSLTVAGAATAPEAASAQFTASLLLDDGTTITLSEPDVTWQVVSGPLSSISTSGLAQTQAVFADATASVRAISVPYNQAFNFTVLDSLPDNFGSYASDGIQDAWQVQYFGQNNPQAAPTRDADNDGQDNLLEYNAGTLPTDPASLFTIAFMNAPAGARRVAFTPWLPNRTYHLERTSTLRLWIDAPGAVISNVSGTGLALDPSAPATRAQYRVTVLKN